MECTETGNPNPNPPRFGSTQGRAFWGCHIWQHARHTQLEGGAKERWHAQHAGYKHKNAVYSEECFLDCCTQPGATPHNKNAPWLAKGGSFPEHSVKGNETRWPSPVAVRLVRWELCWWRAGGRGGVALLLALADVWPPSPSAPWQSGGSLAGPSWSLVLSRSLLKTRAGAPEEDARRLSSGDFDTRCTADFDTRCTAVRYRSRSLAWLAKWGNGRATQ